MLPPLEECDINSDAEDDPNSIIFSGARSVTENVDTIAVTENVEPRQSAADTPTSIITESSALSDAKHTAYAATAAEYMTPVGLSQTETTHTATDNVVQVTTPVATEVSDAATVNEKFAQGTLGAFSTSTVTDTGDTVLKIPTTTNCANHNIVSRHTSNAHARVGEDAVAVPTSNEKKSSAPIATRGNRNNKGTTNVDRGQSQPESTRNTRRPERKRPTLSSTDSALSQGGEYKRRRSAIKLRSNT